MGSTKNIRHTAGGGDIKVGIFFQHVNDILSYFQTVFIVVIVIVFVIYSSLPVHRLRVNDKYNYNDNNKSLIKTKMYNSYFVAAPYNIRSIYSYSL